MARKPKNETVVEETQVEETQVEEATELTYEEAMAEQAEIETEEDMAERTTPVIRPNVETMVKGKKGFRKDDFIGEQFDGVPVEDFIFFASTVGIDTDKYAHLNNGQKRMTVGAILRNRIQDGKEGAEELKAAVIEFCSPYHVEVPKQVEQEQETAQ